MLDTSPCRCLKLIQLAVGKLELQCVLSTQRPLGGRQLRSVHLNSHLFSCPPHQGWSMGSWILLGSSWIFLFPPGPQSSSPSVDDATGARGQDGTPPGSWPPHLPTSSLSAFLGGLSLSTLNTLWVALLGLRGVGVQLRPCSTHTSQTVEFSHTREMTN